MKHYEFNYSNKFFCVSNKCKHNCCIGWEIKINKSAFSRYQDLIGIDKRFNQSCFDNEKFNLQDGRCPFLDEDNLCYIIKNYGEKALCKTCKTHPRFINFFSFAKETGLGLYCENAASIILSSKDKMKLVLTKDDYKKNQMTKFEKTVISFRKKAISIIQNRKLTLNDKINLLNKMCEIDLDKKSFTDWINTFKSLEKLDTSDNTFKLLESQSCFAPFLDNYTIEYEQLLSYFAFRHLSRAIDSLDLRIRLAFIILCLKMINQILSTKQELTFDNLVETCRFFSSEVECSDDNICFLLNEIENLVSFL